MRTLLAKFIITCFVCEFIGHATGVPLKDDRNQEHIARTKRSPANNFSLFGFKTPFSIPDPMASVQQTVNNFGKLFTPGVTSVNEKILHKPKPTEIESTHYEIKHIRETTTSSTTLTTTTTPTPMPYVNKTVAAPPSTILTKPNLTMQNIGLHKHDKNTLSQIENIHNSTKFVHSAKPNGISDTSNKHSDDTDKKSEEIVPIDKDFIDFIFKDLKDSTTTEDSTSDYTTVTGEYDSTTTDELLRIPAPVLATLLGG